MATYVFESQKNGRKEIEPYIDFENTLHRLFEIEDAWIGDRFYEYDGDISEDNLASVFELVEMVDDEYDPVLVWVQCDYDAESDQFVLPQYDMYGVDDICEYLA